MRKITTEKKINHPTLRVKIGTIDKKNPESIYIEVGTYITPTNESGLKKDIMKTIETSFRRKIYNNIRNSPYLTTKYILDFDVAGDRMKLNKKTYIDFQCTLQQETSQLMKLTDISKNTQLYIDNILKDFQDELINNSFVLSKTKK